MTMIQPESNTSRKNGTRTMSRSNATKNQLTSIENNLQPAPSNASFQITLDPEGHKVPKLSVIEKQQAASGLMSHALSEIKLGQQLTFDKVVNHGSKSPISLAKKKLQQQQMLTAKTVEKLVDQQNKNTG